MARIYGFFLACVLSLQSWAYKEVDVLSVIDSYHSTHGTTRAVTLEPYSWWSPFQATDAVGRAVRGTGNLIRGAAEPTHDSLQSIPVIGTAVSLPLPEHATSKGLLGVGNMLRYTGSFLTAETPRLARDLHTFWNEILADPKGSVFGSETALFKRALMSVSCALFLHEGVESVADTRQFFRTLYITQ